MQSPSHSWLESCPPAPLPPAPGRNPKRRPGGDNGLKREAGLDGGHQLGPGHKWPVLVTKMTKSPSQWEPEHCKADHGVCNPHEGGRGGGGYVQERFCGHGDIPTFPLPKLCSGLGTLSCPKGASTFSLVFFGAQPVPRPAIPQRHGNESFNQLFYEGSWSQRARSGFTVCSLTSKGYGFESSPL